MLFFAAVAAAFLAPHGPLSAPVAGASLASRRCIVAAAAHKYLVGPIDVDDCATAYLEKDPELAINRLCIVAKTPPLTDKAIGEFLPFIGQVLDHGEPYSVLWNVEGRVSTAFFYPFACGHRTVF